MNSIFFPRCEVKLRISVRLQCSVKMWLNNLNTKHRLHPLKDPAAALNQSSGVRAVV